MTECLQKKIEDELDRLCEDLHDFVTRKLGLKGSGYAKKFQPIVWTWYEERIKEEAVRDIASSISVQNKCNSVFCNGKIHAYKVNEEEKLEPCPYVYIKREEAIELLVGSSPTEAKE